MIFLMQSFLAYTPVLGAFGLLLAVFLAIGINRLSPGTVAENTVLIQAKSLTGAFLNRYYIIAAGIALVVFFMLGMLQGWPNAASFLAGVLTSLLLLHRSGLNLQRAGERAAYSPAHALAILLCAGKVNALLAMALLALSCGLLMLIRGTPESLSLFVLGVCLPAMLYAGAVSFFLLARKHPRALLEDSSLNCERNAHASCLLLPGATSLDLYSSCAAVLAGAMSLGGLGMVRLGFGGIIMPLAFFAVALLLAIGALLIIIMTRGRGWLKVTAAAIGLFAALILLFTVFAANHLFPPEQAKLMFSVTAGLGVGILLLLPQCFNLSWLSRFSSSPVFMIPLLLLVMAFAYYASGFYGVALAGLAVLLFTGLSLFMQSIEQIQDYRQGIMNSAGWENREAGEEALPEIAAAGETQEKQQFNNVAMVAAAVTLLLAYLQMAKVGEIPVYSVQTLLGLVLGGILPYLFTAWMTGKDPTWIKEEMPDSTAGDEDEGVRAETDPEPDRDCTRSYWWEPVILLGLAAAIPLLTGFLLGKQVLAALLVGSVISAILLVLLRFPGYHHEANLNLLIKFMLIAVMVLAPWMG